MAKVVTKTPNPNTVAGRMKKDPGMEELRVLLQSQGFQKVYEPSIQRWLAQEFDKLATPESKRPEKGEPDDFVRGRISGFRQVLVSFAQSLEVYDKKRLAEAIETPEPAPAGSPYAQDDPDGEGSN